MTWFVLYNVFIPIGRFFNCSVENEWVVQVYFVISLQVEWYSQEGNCLRGNIVYFHRGSLDITQFSCHWNNFMTKCIYHIFLDIFSNQDHCITFVVKKEILRAFNFKNNDITVESEFCSSTRHRYKSINSVVDFMHREMVTVCNTRLNLWLFKKIWFGEQDFSLSTS